MNEKDKAFTRVKPKVSFSDNVLIMHVESYKEENKIIEEETDLNKVNKNNEPNEELNQKCLCIRCVIF